MGEITKQNPMKNAKYHITFTVHIKKTGYFWSTTTWTQKETPGLKMSYELAQHEMTWSDHKKSTCTLSFRKIHDTQIHSTQLQ